MKVCLFNEVNLTADSSKHTEKTVRRIYEISRLEFSGMESIRQPWQPVDVGMVCVFVGAIFGLCELWREVQPPNKDF